MRLLASQPRPFQRRRPHSLAARSGAAWRPSGGQCPQAACSCCWQGRRRRRGAAPAPRGRWRRRWHLQDYCCCAASAGELHHVLSGARWRQLVHALPLCAAAGRMRVRVAAHRAVAVTPPSRYRIDVAAASADRESTYPDLVCLSVFPSLLPDDAAPPVACPVPDGHAMGEQRAAPPCMYRVNIRLTRQEEKKTDVKGAGWPRGLTRWRMPGAGGGPGGARPPRARPARHDDTV